MTKYVKKPVVVEAIQWKGNNLLELRNFLGNDLIENYIDVNYPDSNGTTKLLDSVEIKTLEGNHLVRPGDYIIKGIKGEFYPCKLEIFEETYEEVSNDE